MSQYKNQRLTSREQEIMWDCQRLFNLFREQNRPYKDKVRVARQIAELKDPAQKGIPQLHTLRSTLVNSVADQMDNLPEAIIRPERPDMQEKAEELTDLVQYVHEVNDFPRLYRERVEDNFITGTSVTQYVWDMDAAFGQGDIAIINCPIESVEWDHAAPSLQMGRAVFKKGWYPRSYYKQHYPDKEQYIRSSVYSRSDVEGVTDHSPADEDDEVLLLEYWYRLYDAKTKRYKVHVAYVAGDAMLYCSETARPQGMYAHGMYPFVFDTYTRVFGRTHGNGMVDELMEMQRSVNRYAKYIDDNARMNSKLRMLLSDAADINAEDLEDLSKQVIKAGGGIGDNNLRWFPEVRLSPAVQNNMYSFINMMKDDTGQSAFTRGEVTGGVTARSAITALQEAGGKISRFRTEVFKYGFKDGVEQILWLIKQFYKKDRIVAIVGEDGELKEIKAGELFDKGDLMPYAVRIQTQRRNPMRVQAENDLMMQLFNAMAQQNQALDVDIMIRLLQVDGKDRFLKAIEKAREEQALGLEAQNAVLQQDNQALQEQVAMVKQMMAQQASGLAQTGAEIDQMEQTV